MPSALGSLGPPDERLDVDEQTTPNGDPLVEHGHRGDAPDLAPRDEVRRAANLEHLTTWLGVEPIVLAEMLSVGIDLDLLVFPPTESRPNVMVVTAGMSDSAMDVQDLGLGFAELMLGLPAGWPGLDPLDGDLLQLDEHYWPLRMLKDAARVPSVGDSFLAWGHTIAAGDGAVVAGSDRFVGAIVGPPVPLPGEFVRSASAHGTTLFYGLFPITASEHDFKITTPGGGDALIDRFFEERTTIVIDPARASVAAPPAYTAHVLFSEAKPTAGHAIDHALEHQAETFKSGNQAEGIVQTGDVERVRVRVSGPLGAEQFGVDAFQSPSAQALGPLLRDHQAVATLSPIRGGAGDQFLALVALTTIVLERPDAVAVWLPAQGIVLTPEEFVRYREGMSDARYHVFPAPHEGEGSAVMTRGLEALGGREIRFAHPRLSFDSMLDRVLTVVHSLDIGTGEAPHAGVQGKYAWVTYELRDGVDPASGKPVLDLVEAEKRPGLVSRLFGSKR